MLIQVSDEVTRPNDSTPYAINDVVGDGTVRSLLAIARQPGYGGYFVRARLTTDRNGPDVEQIRMWVYASAPTAIADNAPFTLLYADRAKRLGYIDFPAFTSEGSGSDSSSALITPNTPGGGLPLPFKCDLTSTGLLYMLVTKTGFTPAALQKFYVEILAEVY